tara:strand:+ start:457 stop:1077 length:621 start_codon:yes stop_codon:yes gene_type:complete
MTNKERLENLIDKKRKEDDSDTLEFLESLKSNLEKWGNLTEKQVAALDRIEYLSSDEGLRYAKAWQKEYKENLLQNAKICARYYLANPPYFSDISEKILSNSEFVPTERQYRALCENKYTIRVLKEAHRPPAFAAGDIVQIRDVAAMPYKLHSLKGNPCIVIENETGIVTTHAKGAKVYKVLPFGKSSVVDCQERYLKGFKKPKTA